MNRKVASLKRIFKKEVKRSGQALLVGGLVGFFVGRSMADKGVGLAVASQSQSVLDLASSAQNLPKVKVVLLSVLVFALAAYWIDVLFFRKR
jgi:hypothetical protein